MKRIVRVAIPALCCLALNAAEAQTKLYVDIKTKQVFTEPKEGRVPFELNAATPAPVAVTPAAAPAASTPLVKQWYDKLSIRGYTQFRYTVLDENDADWFHPADRTVSDNQTFLIRRARIILSGDVSDRLGLYVQPEFNAAPSDGDFAVQLRDIYSDIYLDKDKAFRIRVGQSKVPFGFVNMQSSQNRGPMERPDAINSAAEGERDVGAFFYWAPPEIRDRFRMLVRDGLRGSGDYGVFALGAYNGQGLNRSDTNGEPHVVARVTYPIKFENGQIFEPSVQAYTGRFVPRTTAVSLDDEAEPEAPSFDSDGIRDERIGFSAVLYPQPIGFEAEWNFGHGPELSDDYRSINEKSLNGGYIQANAKIESSAGLFFPFVRWQYFDGGRKFGRNAAKENINEWDFGVEYSPFPDVELTAMYSHANSRTNSNVFPYQDVTDGNRLAFQVQVNY